MLDTCACPNSCLKEMDWKKYFDDLALTEELDHRRVGWASSESQCSKFATASETINFDEVDFLLDIGCAGGHFIKMLGEKNPGRFYSGIDISLEQIRSGDNACLRPNLILASMLETPFKSSCFDCVTCIGVLQNFTGSIEDALREIHRILKPGGQTVLIAMDGLYEGLEDKEKGPDAFHRYYAPEELSESLEHQGFKVLESKSIIYDREEVTRGELHESLTFYIYCRKK
ncbi:MAG: methyltransferase domain-containing protein [Candidatus Altiarchaeales archaeon]|nr:methyltransferase domain-containing protein [Candidatus Altiarchaeales archaeon]MBD3416998.1 methyltransferase domain-containing protein [Candidatus Altiarchaeales archaeon]